MTGWRNAMAALALALAVGGTSSAAAQTGEIAAIQKRFNQLHAAGDYDAARAEAEKFEAAAKAAHGTGHAVYANALHSLALVYKELGEIGEAEPYHKRALAIREQLFGASHTEVAGSLNELADLYADHARYAEGEALARRALAIREQALGAGHPDVARTLTNLAHIHWHQGRYSDAEEAATRALAIHEKFRGSTLRDRTAALNYLALVYSDQGRYPQAERVHKRALALREQVLGANHAEVALSLQNLGLVYWNQGRYAEAERLYKRSLSIAERVRGSDHYEVATTLNNLGLVYAEQGRDAEAEALYQRSIAIEEKGRGSTFALSNLALLYADQGRYAEAEALHKRVLAIRERTVGLDHPSVAEVLNNLAIVHHDQRRDAEAEALYKRALAIDEKALGASHPNVALRLNNLARLYFHQARHGDAEPLHKRALAIREQTLGASHPSVAFTLNDLAIFHAASGNVEEALRYSRRAVAAITAHAASELRATRQKERSAGLVEQRTYYFQRHVANLAAAARRGLEPEPALAKEGFETAQWAVHSAAGAALQQMATRLASGSDALAALVREMQDITGFARVLDQKLLASLANPHGHHDRAPLDVLRQQAERIEGRLAALTAQIEKEFPGYAVLASPAPLKAEAVQGLLAPDEALLFWLVGEKESHLFALTRESLEWRTIPLGADALAAKVTAFRRGLDLREYDTGLARGLPVLFDLGRAHELYDALIAPVEALVRDRRHLLLVPTGPLTALPFHLLVTAKPAVSVPKEISAYREVAWLAKRHSTAVLPSIASLKALRVLARKEPARKPMIGFGDPVFGPESPAALRVGSATSQTRAYTEFWQGVSVDRAKLAQALPRLTATADELTAIAQKLGAPENDIHLRHAASETTLKRARLLDYRIVYFATHGLVAGDVKGLAEPSLALTIPQQPSDTDDGLLTASEIAQLKLNADWVVLSACNTIAGDKPGAEALSGLARAFFYAGARGLLVSHWAVDSNAATGITTATFDILKKEPAVGRAEALRRAMLAYMNDPSSRRNAYPAYWAPFVLVGEGAAR